jgi:hypothetical protein
VKQSNHRRTETAPCVKRAKSDISPFFVHPKCGYKVRA